MPDKDLKNQKIWGGDAPALTADWLTMAAPDEDRPARPLAPSRIVEDTSVARSPLASGDGGTSRYRRGILIHALLELLPDLAEDKRHTAAQALLATRAADLSAGDRQALIDEVLLVLNDPQFAGLFGPGSLAEAPIAGHVSELGEGAVISGQIDRLLIADDKIIAVDFKSNRPPPDDPQDVPRAYVWQLAAYRAALRRLYPDRKIVCALLWTDGPRLMTIPNAILDDVLVS